MKTSETRVGIAMRRGVSWFCVVEGIGGKLGVWSGGKPGAGIGGHHIRNMGEESVRLVEAVNDSVERVARVKAEVMKVRGARVRRSEELAEAMTDER